MMIKPSTRRQQIDALDRAWPRDRIAALRPSVRSDLHIHRRGTDGERECAFYLDRDFARSDDHALIHDIRLPDGLGGSASWWGAYARRHRAAALPQPARLPARDIDLDTFGI